MAARPTEQDACQALRDHAVERAVRAREVYGPVIDGTALRRILADRAIVRYPTTIRFDSAPLLPGEFACAIPLGDRPTDGFCVFVHSAFEQHASAWPMLVAYHLVTVNYGELATHAEAEAFGAALLGMDVDDYYHRLCALADGV